MTSSTPYFESCDAAGTTVEFSFPGSVADVSPRFALGYWSIRGFGAPLTMMLCAAKKPFTLFLYDIVEEGSGWNSDYFVAKKEYIKEYKNPLWNLPFCIDRAEKMVIVQTNAVFARIARSCGFMGDNEKSASECEELLCELMDLRNVMVGFCYGGPVSANDGEAAKTVLASGMKHLKKLEAWLEIQASDIHLVEGKMNAPDFHLYEMLDQFEGFCDFYKLGDLFDDLPRLKAFKEGFANLPENQFYLKSWLHTELPFNNTMARFGSLPGPNTYTHGESANLATWRNKGTIAMSPSTPS